MTDGSTDGSTDDLKLILMPSDPRINIPQVYDIQDIKDEVPVAEEITSALLESLEEEDPDLKERLNSSVVGSYLKPEDDVVQVADSSTVSSPLIDAERSLAYLLGVHAAGWFTLERF